MSLRSLTALRSRLMARPRNAARSLSLVSARKVPRCEEWALRSSEERYWENAVRAKVAEKVAQSAQTLHCPHTPTINGKLSHNLSFDGPNPDEL